MASPVLEVRGLKKHFPVRQRLLGRGATWVKAVDGVDFAIHGGETLGLIGESGCGKTTTSKLILRQEVPTAAAIGERVAQVLALVGLEADVAALFPHEFSGGQRQRIAIARALATDTRLIVLDEPVSALDVSVRAQIINQLEHLQRTLGVSYLFIGHDLATVAHISHRIAVMYLGKIVESADSDTLCARPMHPYTQALFAAALPSHPDDPPAERTIAGEVPSALRVPPGRRFPPRCPAATEVCARVEPILQPSEGGGEVACHLYPQPAPIERSRGA